MTYGLDTRSNDGGAVVVSDNRSAPGKRTLTAGLPVQRKAVPAAPPVASTAPLVVADDDPFGMHLLPTVQRKEYGAAGGDLHAAATQGVAGPAHALPHLETIQRLFGPDHDVSGIRAHTDGAARQASAELGAVGYATGNDVAFAGAPDLHLAAHEAAHVVQQRAGVQLAGGFGAADDVHELHADRVADAVVAGQSAAPLLADLPGAGPASTQRAVQLKGIPTATVDQTFAGYYKLEKAKPANKGKPDAAIIQLALDRTRGQIVVGMPDGYVPPPLRGGASAPAPAADPSQSSQQPGPLDDPTAGDPGGQCLDPDGHSVDPNLAPKDPLASLPPAVDPNGQSQDPQAAPAAAAPDLEFAMAFPKIGPFGLELGATTKGDLMASGKWDLKELKPLVVPIFTGVFAQIKPEVTGGFTLKGNPATKEVSLTGVVSASVAATLRVGLPNILSAGVGGKVEGSISITGGWSEAGGWKLGPITIDLTGSLIATGEIGPMEFTTNFASIKLVTVTIGAGGVTATPGPDVQKLWDRLNGWDEESYQYSLAQCNSFKGTDDPNCSMGAGGGVAAPPQTGGGGAGGAGGS